MSIVSPMWPILSLPVTKKDIRMKLHEDISCLHLAAIVFVSVFSNKSFRSSIRDAVCHCLSVALNYYSIKMQKKNAENARRACILYRWSDSLFRLSRTLSQSGLYNRDSALLPVHARISRPRAAKWSRTPAGIGSATARQGKGEKGVGPLL